MNFTDEQMAAPAVIKRNLLALKSEYVVNNVGASSLVDDSLAALKHLELAFVKLVLSAPGVEVQPPTTTASTGAKVVLTVKGEHAFTQVDHPAKEAAKVDLKKNFVKDTFKKLNTRKGKGRKKK